MARVTLQSRFPEIIGTLPRRVSKNIKEGAERVAETAKTNIDRGDPADPHIKDNITTRSAAAEARVEVGGAAYYAKWVEFGRKNAPPYPFLIPALEEETPSILADVQDTLESL